MGNTKKRVQNFNQTDIIKFEEGEIKKKINEQTNRVRIDFISIKLYN